MPLSRVPGKPVSHPLVLTTFYPTRLSREGQEERVKETLGNSLDEGLKTPSSYHDLSYTHHPPSITGVLLDDHEESSLDAAGQYSFIKRTALITTIFVEGEWKFQNGEHKQVREGRLKIDTTTTDA
jgi:hypothetical protein